MFKKFGKTFSDLAGSAKKCEKQLKQLGDQVKFLGMDESRTKYEAVDSIILRGGGRPDAKLLLTNGVGTELVAGKPIIGVIVPSGCEIYVETEQLRTMDQRDLQIYYYDMTIGDLSSKFEGLDGVYHLDAVEVVEQPLPSLNRIDITYRDPTSNDGTGTQLVIKRDYDQMVWGLGTINLGQVTRQQDLKSKKKLKSSIKIVKKKGERKLALDKDI